MFRIRIEFLIDSFRNLIHFEDFSDILFDPQIAQIKNYFLINVSIKLFKI